MKDGDKITVLVVKGFSVPVSKFWSSFFKSLRGGGAAPPISGAFLFASFVSPSADGDKATRLEGGTFLKKGSSKTFLRSH